MASPALPVTLDDVLAAQRLLEGVVRPTPLEYTRGLSERVGAETHLKCENLQRAGSFKIRGAYNRMARLTEEEKARGVVCASAGNHAQGVALAAQMLGLEATVFMPVGAPLPKLQATRGYGAHVEQFGTTIDECLVQAKEFEDRTGAVLIHPFDHPHIVAGAGTCGLEILDQCPDVRTIIVGTGGGGLLAGITTVVKTRRPDVTVIGVQAERAAAYPLSLAAGHPVPLAEMATMADGIAVGCPGEVPYSIISSLVDDFRTVTEEELSRAVLYLLERAKLVVEPAGAASAATLLDAQAGAFEGPIVAVLSGGNIDPLLLLRIIRHGLSAGGRYLQFRVRVPDRPGSLASLLDHLAKAEANVLEIEHVRTAVPLGIDEVEIGVRVETKGADHAASVISDLQANGFHPMLG
ncbi:threonine dehydratase [Intrasporangium chromatireducens Q5-1]|uniref:threonine ammonia-lyase n=1 Tax=Intrasporangium chromatireducens Q5-1 TaxID=584657 RepID=W9GP33_9MICO|nr:threonine ammonia-lyase [Intrasporangium chromatireducens]EWT07900.1 threonine dehydratase [Intrasporangium chromatireducens Q5-1]